MSNTTGIIPMNAGALAPQTLFWSSILGLFYFVQILWVQTHRIFASTFSSGSDNVEIDDVKLGVAGDYGKMNTLIWKAFEPIIKAMKWDDEKKALEALRRVQRAQMNSAEIFPIVIVVSFLFEAHEPRPLSSFVGLCNLFFLIFRVFHFWGLCSNKRISWPRIIGFGAVFLLPALAVKALTLDAASSGL